MTAIWTPPANSVTSLEALVVYGISLLSYAYDGVTAIESDGASPTRIATTTFFPVYSKNAIRVVVRYSAEVKKDALYSGKPIWQSVIPPDGQPPNSIPSIFGSPAS